jgi:hypothetical protein
MSVGQRGGLSVSELADICDALVDAWHHDAVMSADGPAAGSQAAKDFASMGKILDADAVLRFGHIHEQIAGQMVDAIVLFVQSVTTLVRAQPLITFAIWPTVRAELEYAGRIAWLLEPLPDQDVATRRFARAMLEQLSALQRQRFTAGKWNLAQARKFKASRDELHRSITAYFGDVYTPMQKPEQIDTWKIGGEAMMGLGKAAKTFVTLNDANGGAIYDILSDNAHPSIVSLALQAVESSEQAVTMWSYPTIPSVVDFQVRVACLALHGSALMVLRYCGFSTNALDRWSASAPAHWFRSKS